MIEGMFRLIPLPKGRDLESGVTRSYSSELSVTLASHVLRAAVLFKHEAYKSESEFRFLQCHRADVPLPEVKRRYRSHELVKYREFDWRRLKPGVLREIVIGPAADPVKAIRFAEDCLTAFHGAGVEITRSPIPYRAL
jgi:hypothetical protein